MFSVRYVYRQKAENAVNLNPSFESDLLPGVRFYDVIKNDTCLICPNFSFFLSGEKNDFVDFVHLFSPKALGYYFPHI